MIFLQDPDLTILCGDAEEQLRTLPDRSVQMCVTSPPFYGLRDYGVEGQIGLEDTPDLWVERLVAVFREVRRVLRDDGTLWVEVGDSYASQSNGERGSDSRPPALIAAERGYTHLGSNWANYSGRGRRSGGGAVGTVKPKDLLGQPWLLAFALRADGWFLRSDIIWARPNPMPESVTDRPTKAHSYVFLLAKQPRYFFDADAIREESTGDQRPRNTNGQRERTDLIRGFDNRVTSETRKARSVWTIPTQPLPDEHYAAFPEELARRCILAGTSERGCCPECGTPWEREVERPANIHPGDSGRTTAQGNVQRGYRPDGKAIGTVMRERFQAGRDPVTTGWRPACECSYQDGLVTPHPVPCTVLDPFLGSGTTALVARKHGRRCVGIELSETYCEMAARRTSQLSLLAS